MCPLASGRSIVLHLKSQITLPLSPLDSVFSFSEHLELGKKLCMYLVEVVAEEGTQFTGELHRNTTFYFVTKNYPWLRAEWTNRRIFGDWKPGEKESARAPPHQNVHTQRAKVDIFFVQRFSEGGQSAQNVRVVTAYILRPQSSFLDATINIIK